MSRVDVDAWSRMLLAVGGGGLVVQLLRAVGDRRRFPTDTARALATTAGDIVDQLQEELQWARVTDRGA